MLDYGKKYRLRNFYVLKITRMLSKSEYDRLREDIGIPEEYRYNLKKRGLPLIVLGTVSGSWKVEYTPLMKMFRLFDDASVTDGRFDEEEDLAKLVLFFYTSTTVLGDAVFYKEWLESVGRLSDRLSEVSGSEDDAEVLAEMEDNAKTEEALAELKEEVEQAEKEVKKPAKKRRTAKK